MPKVPLYSRAERRERPERAPQAPGTNANPQSAGQSGGDASAAAGDAAKKASAPQRRAWPRWLSSPLPWLATSIVLALLLGQVLLRAPAKPPPTQEQIDRAVLHTLETKTLPSPAARAYEAVQQSVVLVEGQRAQSEQDDEDEPERMVGTGLVIVDTGVILTNLHVVLGADKLRLRFADGTESDAAVVSIQPENDLAVLQAKTLPDDLQAATMRSTGDLAPGDQVIAVGYPFGIGPSVSAGVVSGLKRDYVSPQGKRVLTNLIQFDAAANPGNSGGPLVTMDGEVVGIVTAILNPGESRTFIGIGFAVPIENAAAGAGLPPF
jgi:S1-C subfamily serine protease